MNRTTLKISALMLLLIASMVATTYLTQAPAATVVKDDGMMEQPVTTMLSADDALACHRPAQLKMPEPLLIPKATPKRPKRAAQVTRPAGVKEQPAYFAKSADYLASSQLPSGAWPITAFTYFADGAPKTPEPDCGTTSMCGLALVRNGSTLQAGPHADNVLRALNFLLKVAENAPEDHPVMMIASVPENTTNRGGQYQAVTQPQGKLGTLVDAPLMLRFFAAARTFGNPSANVDARILAAMQVCVDKMESGQTTFGGLKGATWAGGLQSGLALSAFELARAQGCEVGKLPYAKIRNYNDKLVKDQSGTIGSASAGVPLYAYACSQRALAASAAKARVTLLNAQARELLKEDALMTVENLITAGMSEPLAKVSVRAFEKYQKGMKKLTTDNLLSGFGNNGGEEFISFLLLSEAAIISGGTEWDQWYSRMNAKMLKIHHADGSFSGHHCISSTTFCTAMAMLLLTADHDTAQLQRTAVKKLS